MSIKYTHVETPLVRGKEKAIELFDSQIRVEIDPATKNQLNLPSNYEFRSVYLQTAYADWHNRLSNFKVRDDDVWIVGFPKTGTTLTHNIAWQLANGLDFKAPNKYSNDELFEYHTMVDASAKNGELSQYVQGFIEKFNQFDQLPSPRCFKSLLPAFLLPKEVWTVKPKIIYIARNPKDVIASYYHMLRNNLCQYKGTIEEFTEIVRNNQILPTPFFDHMFSFWQLRHLDHVLFMTYEEYLADPLRCVKKISEFLGYSYDDNQLKQLTEYVSYENFRKLQSKENRFELSKKIDPNFRHCHKAKVGGHRDDMSNELIEDLNKWIAEGMKEFDFEFAE